MTDAIKDGLRAVRNAIIDKSIVPGAAAFYVAASNHLKGHENSVGKLKFGLCAFSEALLSIPKILSQNAGLDVQETLLLLTESASKGNHKGIDLSSGRLIDPIKEGIIDNYCVIKQLINSVAMISCNILLVDEIMKAGKEVSKAN